MNKFIKIFVLCFLTGTLISCSDDENITEENTTPYFGVAGEELNQIFSGDSEVRYVTVKTNRDFTITSSETSWCNVEIIDDKVDNLKITISRNEGAAERSAEIIVASAGFDNVVIHVTQTWIASLTTDKSYVLIDNDNLEFTLKIEGNIDYELELPDWINETDSHPDGTHTFEASPIAPGERMGNIIVQAKDELSGSRVIVAAVHRERIKKVGSWLFDDPANLVKAAVGKELEMVRNTAYNPDAQFLSVDGPTADNKAVRIPVNCHFFAEHDIVPPEGLNYITDYTIFLEFKIPVQGRFYSLYQTNITNSDDSELYIRNSIPPTIGVGATGYAGGGLVEVEKWHRLYLSFKTGDIKFFIDGNLFHTSTSADARFRVNPNGIIFCGGPWTKLDDNEFDIAEISIWNGALTLEDIKELEGIE